MTFYRNAVWFMKGMMEYTQGGYQTAAKHFKPEDLDGVTCKGKAYMITGANSGIGKETAMEIAKRGGTVHMVCRNPNTAQEAKDEIIKETGNEDIHVHILDMSEPRRIRGFAREFEDRFKQLNCLVNNAGCMVNTREETADGLEKNFATNTLGTFVLTESLIPLISKTGGDDQRIIIVSSGGMLVRKLDLSDLQSQKLNPFDGTMVYAENKRQQVILTHKWAEKNKGIFFASMHPGWADTPAVRTSMPDFYEKMKNKLRTAHQGADTIIWLAIAKSISNDDARSGGFFQDRVVANEHLPLACTRAKKEDEEKLLEILQEMYEKYQ